MLPKSKPKSKPISIWWIILWFFGLVALAALLTSCGSDTPAAVSTPLPTMTPIPAATNTPFVPPTATDYPTYTPRPTYTPEPPPTETPVPTDTPEPPPTATSKPVVKAKPTSPPVASGMSEAEYSSKFQGWASLYTENLQTVSTLAGNPDFADNDWKLQFIQPFAVFQALYKEIRATDPPPRFVKFHRLFLQAAKDYSDAGDLVAQGLDNYDLDAISAATDKMNAGSDMLAQAQTEMNKLK